MKIIQIFKAFLIILRDGVNVIFRDPLTNLYNRRFFQEIGSKVWEGAKRYGRPLSIVLFDLDDLKWINDNFGHSAGDKTLKEMADVLILHCRKADLAFRWGGDEFLVILPETSEKRAEEFVKRITEKLYSVAIKVSWGIVSCGESFASFEDLIAEAERRLYLQKREKKKAQKGA